MKTTKTTIILLALVLLTAAGAQSAEKPAKKEISNTRTASCLVKITSDPAVLPLSDIAIDYLLRSSGVAGMAARDILDISPDIASELFIFEDIEKMYPGSAGGIGMPLEPTPTRRARIPAFPAASMPGEIVPKPISTRAVPGSRTPPRPTTPARRTPTRRPPTPRAPKVTIPLPSTTEQTILFRLHVDFSNTDVSIKPAAEEFMIALIENLSSALREAFDQYSAKLNNQLLLADTEATRAEVKLVNMQKELRAISGSRDLSRKVILSDIREMRQILQSGMMQRTSNEVLMEATAKRIAETQAEMKNLLVSDTITKELKGLIEEHTRQLAIMEREYQQGKLPLHQVGEIREKLTRAKIELAQRREQVSKSAGGDRINSLNRQLSDYSMQVTQAEAEIRSFEEQLKEAEDLLKNADNYELLSLKVDIAKQSLEETLLWRARLGRNNRSIQPPDVTVIGAE